MSKRSLEISRRSLSLAGVLLASEILLAGCSNKTEIIDTERQAANLNVEPTVNRAGDAKELKSDEDHKNVI